MTKRNVHIIISFCAILFLISASFKKKILVKYTKSEIKIDGFSNDKIWKKLPFFAISEGRNNDKGISGKFKICYDKKFLYVLVVVNDDTPFQNEAGKTWESDNVELYFALDTNNSETYRNTDFELRKVNSKNQIDGGIDVKASTPETLIMSKDFQVVQSDSKTEMVQEWKIPINALNESAKFDGKHLRFEIQLCDHNGSARIGQLYWNSNADDQWTKIKNQGLLILEKKL